MSVTVDVAASAAPARIDAGGDRRRRNVLFRGRTARASGLLLATIALGGVLLCSVAYGAKPIPFSVVLDALFHYDPSVNDHLIVHSLRIPRTLVGLLIGVALGLSGAVMQGVTRNPLADPGILGVNAGAALFVVIGIYSFGVGSLLGYVWFAFAGAALSSVVVYALGSMGRGGATPVKLALAGTAVTAMLASITTAILLLDVATLDQYRFWAVGSLAGRDATIAAQVAPFIAVGTVMALASARLLNALALGDDVARSLGTRVGLARAFSAISVVLLVGAATAAAGPIAFVGLTVPHVARAITGPDYRWVLPYSAVLAPILLLGSDVIGRVVARPGEVQVGIVTALVGSPFFVALVRRRKLAELWGVDVVTAADLELPVSLLGAAGDRRTLVRRARTAGRRRALAVSVALSAATALMFCVSISVGDFPIPLVDVVAAIFGHGNPDSDFIVNMLRLPRALTAVMVGGAFGFSGAIFQSIARNPLASPDIIGITSGASAAAVFIIVVLGGTYEVVSLGALGGALLTAAVIYLLAYKQGVSSYRLVLVGVGVGAVLQSITSYLLTRAEIYDAQRATVWLTGSLNGRGWEHVRPIGWALAVLIPAVLLLARPLRALQLGDDTAQGLGVGVERSRLALVLVAVVLVAVATAAAGPITFVAFVAAPIARRLTNSSLTLVPAALVGALLLLVSDLVARRAFAPTELPVGIVTGVIGAPYLLWLLARANKIGSGG